MNKNSHGSSKCSVINAMLLIAACAVSTALQAQNAYRCGNNYSQTPCPGASALNVDDARTQAQKQQTDTASRSDATRADRLEKERLAQEKATRAYSSAASPAAATVHPQTGSTVVNKITPKRVRSNHKKPSAFVAQVPGSEKTPALKKTPKK
jgi:hypothetical protein